MEAEVAAPHWQRSYWDHDTQNCGAASFGREIVMTILLVWNFVSNVLNVLRGVDAPVVLFASFIYAFGCLTVMVFFFVFHRAQR